MKLVYIIIALIIFLILIITFTLIYRKNKQPNINPEEYERYLINLKREKLTELRKLIHLNPHGEYAPEKRIINITEEMRTSSILSGALLGGSLAGITDSYYNIHHTFSENEDFITIMEERFNRKFLNADKDKWLETLNELNSSSTMKNVYISNYAGYKAELLGKQKLEQLGYNVEQFENRIHPDDDLEAITPSGERINISVKSYESVDSLKNAVKNHPNSTHYLINEDLYTKIRSSTKLESWFEDRNIKLINGGYSNSELRKTAEDSIDAFNGMNDSISEELLEGAMENLFDGIPVAALVCFGFKVRRNKKALNQGHQSDFEYKMNFAGDGAGMVTRAAAAVAMGKVGAIAGVGFGPAGVAVGGFVGGFLGAIGAGQLISHSKNQLKWGPIYKSQYEVTKYYENQLFGYKEKNWLMKHVLKTRETEEILKKYKAELAEYNEELDENSAKMPSLNAVVLEQSIKDIENYLALKDAMLDKILQYLKKEFTVWEQEINDRNNKKDNRFILNRLLGEWVLVQTAKNNFPIDRSLKDSFNIYLKRKEISPNYPTKFPFDPIHNLTVLATTVQLEMIEKVISKTSIEIDTNKNNKK